MPDVKLTYNLDIDPWTDLALDAKAGLVSRVGIMPDGTESGRPVIIIAVRPDSETGEAIGQMTWNQFKQLYEAIAASPVIALDEMC